MHDHWSYYLVRGATFCYALVLSLCFVLVVLVVFDLHPIRLAMDRLLHRSGLADVGVDGAAVLEGAAAGLSLAAPFCEYLLAALADAVMTTADSSQEQPHLNRFTVFAERWHATSLANLSGADVANLWRLAEYLLLDALCLRCIADVVVQRQLRSGVRNHLLSPVQSEVVVQRVADVDALLEWEHDDLQGQIEVAKGLAVPWDWCSMETAALWGQQEAVQQARAARVEWDSYATQGDSYVPAEAAAGGHLRLLQWMRQQAPPCPWDDHVILASTCRHHNHVAIWALENKAPRPSAWIEQAAKWGNLTVLQWARNHGRLQSSQMEMLLKAALDEEVFKYVKPSSLPAPELRAGKQAVVTWLQSLPHG